MIQKLKFMNYKKKNIRFWHKIKMIKIKTFYK